MLAGLGESFVSSGRKLPRALGEEGKMGLGNPGDADPISLELLAKGE